MPAELVVCRLDHHPGGAGRHDERRDAVVRASGDRDDRRDVGATVRDERLRAVQHPLVAVEHGARPGRSGVGSAVGFGQPERTERSPGHEVGQPLVALVVGAEPEDRIGAEPDAGRQGDPHRLVDPTEFLDGDTQRGEVAPATTPPLGEHDAEQPEFAHRLHHVDWEVAVPVPFGGVRRDLLLGELAHRGSQQFMVVAQLPAHRRRR